MSTSIKNILLIKKGDLFIKNFHLILMGYISQVLALRGWALVM